MQTFIYLTGDILHLVKVVRLLASSAKLLEVNLVITLYVPHISTFPPDVAVLAMIIAIFLL